MQKTAGDTSKRLPRKPVTKRAKKGLIFHQKKKNLNIVFNATLINVFFKAQKHDDTTDEEDFSDNSNETYNGETENYDTDNDDTDNDDTDNDDTGNDDEANGTRPKR